MAGVSRFCTLLPPFSSQPQQLQQEQPGLKHVDREEELHRRIPWRWTVLQVTNL